MSETVKYKRPSGSVIEVGAGEGTEAYAAANGWELVTEEVAEPVAEPVAEAPKPKRTPRKKKVTTDGDSGTGSEG